MIDKSSVQLDIKDKTAIITMNRPQVYNALTRQAKLELMEAVERATKDESIRSLVLTGSGKAFSSGQDLQEGTNLEEGEDFGHILQTQWNPLIQTIRNCPKIVIASINGVCAGAGISLALACDLIISCPRVKFVAGFSKLGLVPDAGLTFAMVRSFGYHQALSFFLFNHPFIAKI